MAKVSSSFEELIGNTPLVELQRIEKEYCLKGRLFAKCEFMEPAGSAKDRAALYMINKAERDGLLDKDTVIIEETSGNTGIGLAAVAAVRGYRIMIVMPDNMSAERIKLMKAYGAEVVLTPGALGMQGSLDKANELARSLPKAVIAGQFDNPANPLSHYETTGPEIREALCGRVDAFVAGIGTGGTISGVGRYLKEKNPETKIIGVEPLSSPLITEGFSGEHKIQGLGANFIPKNYDKNVVDRVFAVSDEDALKTARMLAKKEALLVGISSGAALWQAMKLAEKEEYQGKNIVALLPDSGSRYLSTELFEV